MSEYRATVTIYAGEHDIGRGEVRDANLDNVLNAVGRIADDVVRRCVRQVLSGYDADTVIALLDASRFTGEDEDGD